MYIQSGTQSPIRDAIGTSRTFGVFHERIHDDSIFVQHFHLILPMYV